MIGIMQRFMISARSDTLLDDPLTNKEVPKCPISNHPMERKTKKIMLCPPLDDEL